MRVPGGNILNRAFRLIDAQTLQYLAFVSRSANSIGMWVDVYANAVSAKGSIQPVPRTMMETLGLDMQRHYVMIFVPQSVVDVRRDVTSDRFIFNNAVFQALSITKWFTVDGWNQVLAVEVPLTESEIISTESGIGITTESGNPIAADVE